MTSRGTLAVRFDQLRREAVALRRQGKSRREIQEILHVGSNATLNDLLRGEPPLASTWRPRAKEDLHARARELRAQGMSYDQIVAELGVSKSSVSLWVRDMPKPGRLSYEECRRRQTEAVDAYWAAERRRRERERGEIRVRAREGVGSVSERDILLAGAIAYWCEGTKSKPYRRSNRVVFMNSDPRLISFYLNFLDLAGVTRDQLAFQVSIHEKANVAEAERFWLRLTQADPGQFRAPNIKKHNPHTVRLNTGDTYRGCLRVEVLRSGPLYQQIEGWCEALLGQADVTMKPFAAGGSQSPE